EGAKLIARQGTPLVDLGDAPAAVERDAYPSGRAGAEHALLNGVSEQRPHNGDVPLDRRAGESVVGAPRVRLVGQPLHERLDVARLDLREAELALGVEVRDEPLLEHLPVPAAGRFAEAARRASLVVLDPRARVLTEG